MKYFIAYKDFKGKDDNGMPWVHPENGYDDLDHAVMICNDFKNRGFKDVILFNSDDDDASEEFTWYYVKDNKIR